MFCNGIFINSLREGIKKIVDRSVNSGGWGVWATLSPTTRTGIFFYLQKSFFALRWGGGAENFMDSASNMFFFMDTFFKGLNCERHLRNIWKYIFYLLYWNLLFTKGFCYIHSSSFQFRNITC